MKTLTDVRAFTLAAALAGLTGCALPVMGRLGSATRSDFAIPSATDVGPTTDVQPPVVEVREFPHSSIVSVVGWLPDAPDFGLHARLRRGDGSLIRDHRLYVSTYYMGNVPVSDPRVYTRPVVLGQPTRLHGVVETVTPANQVVEATGITHDDRACYYDVHTCTPFETFDVRVPDEMLRANRDSVAIRLYGRGGTEMIVTVRRDIIDPYLAKVDSVSASLRNKK
jgi:hypothetical protein